VAEIRRKPKGGDGDLERIFLEDYVQHYGTWLASEALLEFHIARFFPISGM
jgi:hypothetical protein